MSVEVVGPATDAYVRIEEIGYGQPFWHDGCLWLHAGRRANCDRDSISAIRPSTIQPGIFWPDDKVRPVNLVCAAYFDGQPKPRLVTDGETDAVPDDTATRLAKCILKVSQELWESSSHLNHSLLWSALHNSGLKDYELRRLAGESEEG